MTELSSFKDGKQFAWDSTSLKLVETCHYKYYLKMGEGWSNRRKSVHLLFGGWFADAREHYYKYRALGATSNEALCKVVREALIATWDDEKGVPWVSDHNTKTRENLIRTIVWYVDQFENDKIEVIKLADGKPAVELSFALPVDNGIIFCGHLDSLVNYSDDLYVMDQKTTQSTISSYWFDQFTPDTQMSMYTFAGKMIYKMPVKGVIIDGAQIAVGFTRFERGFAFRSEGQLNEWYDGAMAHIEAIHRSTKNNFFPMNTTSCGMFGGCEFRSICSRSPEVRERFLEGDFERTERWNPLKTR